MRLQARRAVKYRLVRIRGGRTCRLWCPRVEDHCTARLVRDVTAILLFGPIAFPARVATQAAPPAPTAHQKLTFEGDTALWTVAIKLTRLRTSSRS